MSAVQLGIDYHVARLTRGLESVVRSTRKLVGVALLGLAVLAIPGCNKLTQRNYDKIQPGMSVSQVDGILGKAPRRLVAARVSAVSAARRR